MSYVLDTNYATVGDLEGLPQTSISKLAVAKFGPAVNAEKSLKRPGLSTVEARPEVTVQAPTGLVGSGPSEPTSGGAPVESWFSQYKWWLAGGTAALAILVSVILVLISRKSASAAIPPTADWSN